MISSKLKKRYLDNTRNYLTRWEVKWCDSTLEYDLIGRSVGVSIPEADFSVKMAANEHAADCHHIVTARIQEYRLHTCNVKVKVVLSHSSGLLMRLGLEARNRRPNPSRNGVKNPRTPESSTNHLSSKAYLAVLLWFRTRTRIVHVWRFICSDKWSLDPRPDAKSDANCAQSETNQTPSGVEKHLWTMAVWKKAVREPACIGNDVTEVGRHLSSSPPSPSLALKRARYHFTAG